MLSLNTLFQNGAVFQQKKIIPVWGNTEKQCTLKAEFANQTVFTMSSLTGQFMFRLLPVDAGGPFELKITNLDSGEIIEFFDILVGEVWLASGQSNMEYKLNTDWAIIPPTADENFVPSKVNAAQLKEFCSTVRNTDNLRYFSVEKNASGIKEENVKGSWQNLSPDNAPECSAVAAWFARYIRENLNVPVGIIISAWGGTIVEAWTGRSGLMADSDTYNMLTDKDRIFAEQSTWASEEECKTVIQKNLQKYADPGNEGLKAGWAEFAFDDVAWKKFTVPGSWIGQKIAGNGVLWARKKITIPSGWLGKDITLNLGGIDKTDITYFNGVEIGKTGTGFDSTSWNRLRQYTIPAKLVKTTENVIAIRAYTFCLDGSFNGTRVQFNLCCNGETLPLHGEWRACAEVDFGVVGESVGKAPRHPNVPSILFDGMINPLIPYTVRGAIWYQGESNATSIREAKSYYKKLQNMINDWRYHWGNGTFPFIQVQLANCYRNNIESQYDDHSAWAILRDIQRKLCNDMSEVYMASAIDIGEFYDIHPQDKKSVGKRLADNALHNVYCKNNIEPFGPLYEKYRIEGNKIRIQFRYASGMYLKKNKVQSFYISGSDKIFYPADDIEIDGNSVLVSSVQVEKPCSVRYAWSDYPESTLYNKANLPASPFRTDDWEL